VEGTCDRCGGHNFYQREDDKPETVKNRLEVNIKNSEPILEYYEAQGVMHTIDGDRDIQEVFVDIEKIIANKN
jgi:adenylate kinase